MDLNLTINGSLENIAPGETIDSARFIGDRCYLSTSIVRRDPFFVIDVENVYEPKILGYLKIPGFTRYLHPYDENHVIGIGKDGNDVKISFFDVSNVSSPIEIALYALEGAWSDTPVLSEHKAFLFDKSKELLVIPVSIWSTFNHSSSLWQGAYAFTISLTLEQKIMLRGNITHVESGHIQNGSYDVKRTLFIGDVLYTISESKIKMNSLLDLSEINELSLNE
jgi:uncharacterized secreted protein with C-terminal beta-propeller domain